MLNPKLEAKVSVTNLVGFRGHAENQQETNRTSTMLVIMMRMLLLPLLLFLLMMALPATPFSGSATPRCTACVDNIKQRRKKLLSARTGRNRAGQGKKGPSEWNEMIWTPGVFIIFIRRHMLALAALVLALAMATFALGAHQ